MIEDLEFRGCNLSFSAAMPELRKNGKRDTKHFPEIYKEDKLNKNNE